jgi:hypothetical protein
LYCCFCFLEIQIRCKVNESPIFLPRLLSDPMARRVPPPPHLLGIHQTQISVLHLPFLSRDWTNSVAGEGREELVGEPGSTPSFDLLCVLLKSRSHWPSFLRTYQNFLTQSSIDPGAMLDTFLVQEESGAGSHNSWDVSSLEIPSCCEDDRCPGSCPAWSQPLQ